MTFTITSQAAGDSLKAHCHKTGLDAAASASRIVADRFVHHWSEGFGPLPVMIVGGLMFRQEERETRDADIRTVRRYSAVEVDGGLRRLVPVLAREGIVVHRIHAVENIDIGMPDPVARYRIDASIGTVRANTHLDISAHLGPDAWPKGSVRTKMPSVHPRFPAAEFLAQPFAAAAAEKLLAVVMQSDTDYRCKHIADIISFDLMGMSGPDVARELARTCRYRGINPAHLPVSPASLSMPSFEKRRVSWERLQRERGLDLTLDQAWIDINYIWKEQHAYLEAHLYRARREQMAADAPALRPAREYADNVVAFRR